MLGFAISSRDHTSSHLRFSLSHLSFSLSRVHTQTAIFTDRVKVCSARAGRLGRRQGLDAHAHRGLQLAWTRLLCCKLHPLKRGCRTPRPVLFCRLPPLARQDETALAGMHHSMELLGTTRWQLTGARWFGLHSHLWLGVITSTSVPTLTTRATWASLRCCFERGEQ